MAVDIYKNPATLSTMKRYQLILKFADRTITVDKEFTSNKDAIFWAQLCIDICGKDENGISYEAAILFDDKLAIPVKGWKIKK